MTQAEMQAIIAKLQAENAALKAKPGNKLTLKIGEKGALSIYGMGRFPVTLYKSQWQRLLEIVPQITEFLKANDSLLKEKGA